MGHGLHSLLPYALGTMLTGGSPSADPMHSCASSTGSNVTPKQAPFVPALRLDRIGDATSEVRSFNKALYPCLLPIARPMIDSAGVHRADDGPEHLSRRSHRPQPA